MLVTGRVEEEAGVLVTGRAREVAVLVTGRGEEVSAVFVTG